MRDMLAPALFVAGAGLVALGLVRRRRRRLVVHRAGALRPEYAGMSDFARPLLLWMLALCGAETSLHYFMFGGSAFLSPVDFAGLLFLLAGFAAYVLLAVRKPVIAETEGS